MKKHTIYKSEKGKELIKSHYDFYVGSMNLDFEHKYVDTRLGKTHILLTGPKEGKPLIILQGGNCINPMTLSWFSPLLKEYRVYAPDTIGHPGYSEEVRLSTKDEGMAFWLLDLMENLQIKKSAFVGPSYGAGIILRLATYLPEKLACSVLVSPSGINLSSKLSMIRKILIPLLGFKLTSSKKKLQLISDVMSMGSMKEIDEIIVGDIFKYVKLEQDMPKLTTRDELLNYSAPTLVIAGKQDIFFPGELISKRANEIIPNLISTNLYDMGHFPSEECLRSINLDIKQFFETYY